MELMSIYDKSVLVLGFLAFVSVSVAQGTNSSSEDKIEMDYDLPPKTSDFCRSKVSSLEESYREKIREQQSRKSELRKDFYSKVPTTLESCDPPPMLVNVSEAPDSMPDKCRENLRHLNSEITSQTGAGVGSKVPDSYRDEYEKALKGCVAGGVVQKLESTLRNKIFGEAKASSSFVRVFESFMNRIKSFLIENPSAGEQQLKNNVTDNFTETEGSNSIEKGVLSGFKDLF